jgi:hypothetical protein
MNQSFSFKSLREFNRDLNRQNLVIELEKQKIERNEKTKRKRKYEAIWKKNESKLKKNSVRFGLKITEYFKSNFNFQGNEYFNNNGYLIGKKSFTPFNECCLRLKCFEKISFEKQEDFFEK